MKRRFVALSLLPRLIALGRFAVQVGRNFHAHQSWLLASAIAYNALLSLIPLLFVAAAATAWLHDADELLHTAQAWLGTLLPGDNSGFLHDTRTLFAARHSFGWIGALVLLFFSAATFRAIDEAFRVIFGRPAAARAIFGSMLIPYLFVMLLSLALFAVTLLRVVLEAWMPRWLAPAGIYWPGVGWLGQMSALLVLVALYAGLYRFVPARPVPPRHALIGGVVAASLWELTRLALAWYFESLSMVSAIYGSAATIVIVLISAELGAVILLLGAEVIAQLNRDHT
jgi:YihY family inner membrane protein